MEVAMLNTVADVAQPDLPTSFSVSHSTDCHKRYAPNSGTHR